MAKKRRIIQQQEEEEEIVIDSKFDEKEFILGDMYGTKVLAAIFVFAIVSGIICAVLQYYVFHEALGLEGKSGLWICLILIVVAMYFMKPLFTKLGFHMDMLENKTMIGNYIMYLLLTLGVWILILNNPFIH